MLDAALPTVLHPHGPEHLCRQISRGVKTLWFLLQVNALQPQRTDALDGLVVRLASDPAEGLVSAAVGEHDVIVIPGNSSDQRDCSGEIFDLGRHRESRIHHHRHGEFTASAVVDDAPLGCKRNRALLLMSCLLYEFSVAEDLQVDQTSADGDEPQQEYRPQQIQPRVFAKIRTGGCHGVLSRRIDSLLSNRPPRNNRAPLGGQPGGCSYAISTDPGLPLQGQRWP